MKSVISEFTQYDVGAEELERVMESGEIGPQLYWKLHDIQKLQEMEQSFSNAYLNEMERMRRRYNELTEQVAIYENELNEAMERLEAEQARLIQENKAKNQQYEEAANKAVQKLKQSIQDACQFPVDIFYPHAIQRYIEAGEEAEKLLQNKLYTLAVPKAECALML